MTNEYDAMRQLADSKVEAIKDGIRDRKQQALLSKNLERKRMNEIFWCGVMRFITHITLASIVIYILIHFI